MNQLRRLWVIVPAVLLLAVLGVLWATRGTMGQLEFLRRGVVDTGLVDQSPYQTAQTLAGLAASAEEQGLAQQAERLADHEVDQAFAQALREASLRQPNLTGEAAGIAARVKELKAMVADDQGRVEALTRAAASSGTAAAAGDDLDVAKAQLGLENDELTDAASDLARETGDRREEIQSELAARETAMQKGGADTKESAVKAVQRHGTLWARGAAWLEQRSRAALLDQAQGKALGEARSLEARHEEQERRSVAAAKVVAGTGAGGAGAAGLGAAGPEPPQGTARVKLLEAMSTRRVMMSILDDRVQTDRQLAAVYVRWEQQVWLQHRIVAHLLLESLALLLAVGLLAALAGVLGTGLVRRVTGDTRRAQTLERIVLLAVNVLALVGALLVVFGVPAQMPTILGLATAGLTVVFQDFILAFFGYFVLMGKNGIRVCDWVEIDGVGGEVAEIGLFKTILLETGNWTSRGHPTGRRVMFSNSFAIRGQYFNYSTSGQWMWDEIILNVPATRDATALLASMQTAVEAETAKDAEQAEQEWRLATRSVGLSQFAAQPSVSLRPAAAGMDILVRFVTRASERFEVRTRLYEKLVGLMEGADKETA